MSFCWRLNSTHSEEEGLFSYFNAEKLFWTGLITGRAVEEKSVQISSGNALINFTAPRGVYLYSLSVEGNVTTGKLVISE